MFKRIHALTMSCILAMLIVSLATGGELRKLGEYDLSWGPYNTTWTSPGGKVVRYIPRYFDNNAFADNLSLFGKSLTGDGTGSITGFSVPLYLTNYLSVYDSLTAWTDVRAYGAVGDNTTDDTAAIQAAIDASGGIVFFPPGIYVISSTLNLKTATEYRGPRGGTFVVGGGDTPSTGYGAALRWAGAANGIMVNMESTYNSVWEGIDLDGVDYTDNVTGIHLHGDNDPPSQRNNISNVRMWNLGYGVIVGGLPGQTSYTNQADGWTIERFNMWIVGTGIYVNGGNSTQYSSIRNGLIGQYDAGINVYEGAGAWEINNVAFASLESPAAGEANIILRLPRELTISHTQGEPHAGTLWPHIRFTLGATMLPVHLYGNHFDGDLQIANSNSSQKIVSSGNNYDNIVITGNDIQLTSTGDYFTASASIQDGGGNNLITEIDNYYEGVGYVVYRRTFNNLTKETRGYNTVDHRSNGLVAFSADDATPSVLNGDFFKTINANPTTITNFDDGVEGQKIWVWIGDTNTTIDFSDSYIRGNAGVDNVIDVGDWLDCRNLGGYWYCLKGDWR